MTTSVAKAKAAQSVSPKGKPQRSLEEPSGAAAVFSDAVLALVPRAPRPSPPLTLEFGPNGGLPNGDRTPPATEIEGPRELKTDPPESTGEVRASGIRSLLEGSEQPESYTANIGSPPAALQMATAVSTYLAALGDPAQASIENTGQNSSATAPIDIASAPQGLPGPSSELLTVPTGSPPPTSARTSSPPPVHIPRPSPPSSPLPAFSPEAAVRVRAAATGARTASVELDHPVFGRIRADLAVDPKGLGVQLFARSHAAAAALKATESVLRSNVAVHGVTLRTLNVTVTRMARSHAAKNARNLARARSAARRKRPLDMEA